MSKSIVVDVQSCEEDIRIVKEKLSSPSIQKTKDVNSKNYVKIGRLNDPKIKFVYSYGIKQLLSHIIGLTNLDVPDKNCSNSFQNNHGKVRFVTLYNELPDYKEKDAAKKIQDFLSHETIVSGLLTKKIKEKTPCEIEILEPLSYQTIFENNKDYFTGMEKVVDFYHLKREVTN